MVDVLITPRREKHEPQLPVRGIFALNPSDNAAMITLAKEYGLGRHFLFNSQLFSNEQFFLAGPAVGAPMATICLEKLIALGARRIVVYGWCGSIHADLRISNLFVPMSGLSEEGTSPHYATETPWNPALQQALRDSLKQGGHEPQSGTIWTTDALYRETRPKIENYGRQGILAVDMEFTALQAVATFRGVELAALMLVSDELFGARWRSGYQHKSFRSLSRQTLGLLVSLVQKAVL